jgi:hypothetical protein
MSVDGQSRKFIAAFDTMTGELLPWHESGIGSCNLTSGKCAGKLAADSLDFAAEWGSSVYVVGKEPGLDSRYLGVLDAATGKLRPWHAFAANYFIDTVAANAGIVIVGGEFSSAG